MAATLTNSHLSLKLLFLVHQLLVLELQSVATARVGRALHVHVSAIRKTWYLSASRKRINSTVLCSSFSCLHAQFLKEQKYGDVDGISITRPRNLSLVLSSLLRR